MEDAEKIAEGEILMQLSSHVEAVLTVKQKSEGGKLQAVEQLEMFLGKNSLRGAELESTYEENGRHWELALEDYRSEDSGVVLSGKNVIIRVINFLPFETELTPSQRDGLVRLSETLFQELYIDGELVRGVRYPGPRRFRAG